MADVRQLGRSGQWHFSVREVKTEAEARLAFETKTNISTAKIHKRDKKEYSIDSVSFVPEGRGHWRVNVYFTELKALDDLDAGSLSDE